MLTRLRDLCSLQVPAPFRKYAPADESAIKSRHAANRNVNRVACRAERVEVRVSCACGGGSEQHLKDMAAMRKKVNGVFRVTGCGVSGREVLDAFRNLLRTVLDSLCS